MVRSKRGRFLAIPTENAPRRGTDGKRISPSTFPEHRFELLRFVPRPSGPPLLVVDGLRAWFSRKTGELRGFRRATDGAAQRPGSDHGRDVPVPAQAQARGRGAWWRAGELRLPGREQPAAGRMLTVTLTNDLDGTVYL